MEGIVGAFRRFSLTTDYNIWSPQFSKLVDQTCQPRLSISQRVVYLNKCEQWVSPPVFLNKSNNDLLNAKSDLLRLWNYLLEFVTGTVDSRNKALAFSLIGFIMQRHEFRLDRLGFGPKSSRPTCPTDHLKLAKQCKTLLVKTFIYVNTCMDKKGRSVELVQFAAQTLSVFFFRLPVVGTRIVDALETKCTLAVVAKEKEAEEESSKASDRCRDEWDKWLKQDDCSIRGTGSDEQAANFIKTNPDLYEWNYFYSDNESEMQSLRSILNNPDNSCMNWLTSKDLFFLSFVEMYVDHVVRVCGGKTICWTVLPGYQLLLQSFWPLLHSAIWWDGIAKRVSGEGVGSVRSFPAYMRVKRTAMTLLKFKGLLNKFILMTYECTNVYSLLSIDSCIEHLNLWFTTVAVPVNPGVRGVNEPPSGPGSQTQKAQLKLPDSFDYEMFWFGMCKLLESDLFQALLKTCSFLYNNFHLFRGSKRIELVNSLLSTFFFRLFLHWSSEVRTYFQHLLVYKVLRADRRYLPCFTDTQVMTQYGEEESAQKSLNATEKAKQTTRNHERRMSVFDETNKIDNEELLIDISHCSKIDSFIQLCIDKDESIPAAQRVYIDFALCQYAALLKKYYKGVQLNSLDSIPLLTHRMVLSDSNPYNN